MTKAILTLVLEYEMPEGDAAEQAYGSTDPHLMAAIDQLQLSGDLESLAWYAESGNVKELTIKAAE